MKNFIRALTGHLPFAKISDEISEPVKAESAEELIARIELKLGIQRGSETSSTDVESQESEAEPNGYESKEGEQNGDV
jgi:hypothetical protein